MQEKRETRVTQWCAAQDALGVSSARQEDNERRVGGAERISSEACLERGVFDGKSPPLQPCIVCSWPECGCRGEHHQRSSSDACFSVSRCRFGWLERGQSISVPRLQHSDPRLELFQLTISSGERPRPCGAIRRRVVECSDQGEERCEGTACRTHHSTGAESSLAAPKHVAGRTLSIFNAAHFCSSTWWCDGLPPAGRCQRAVSPL